MRPFRPGISKECLTESPGHSSPGVQKHLTQSPESHYSGHVLDPEAVGFFVLGTLSEVTISGAIVSSGPKS